MRPRILRTHAAALLSLAVVVAFGTGCTPLLRGGNEPSPTAAYRLTEDNIVIWLDELEFRRPGPEWKLAQIANGDEFSFAFLKTGNCPPPCQSTFAFDEEPFGYSTDLRERMEEFFRRFLWGSHAVFGDFEAREVEVFGGPGLAAVAEGRDPVKGQKVRAKVILGRRGGRVVAAFLTEWRTEQDAYDDADVAIFDRFVGSLRFLKPSFYETL